MVTRRDVVTALAGVPGLTMVGIPVAAAQPSGRNRPELRLQKGEKLVMIGDSITDYPATINWDRVHPNPTGSVLLARAFLTAIGFDWQRGLEPA